MPIDAVFLVATVPQKNFERTLISFANKLDNIGDNGGKYKLQTFICSIWLINTKNCVSDNFHDDYYEDKTNKQLYMEKVYEPT